jgi:hypothetical protein
MSVPIGRLILSSSLVDPRAPLPRSTPRAGGRWAGRAHERPREARGARRAVGWRAGVRAPRALGESAVRVCAPRFFRQPLARRSARVAPSLHSPRRRPVGGARPRAAARGARNAVRGRLVRGVRAPRARSTRMPLLDCGGDEPPATHARRARVARRSTATIPASSRHRHHLRSTRVRRCHRRTATAAAIGRSWRGMVPLRSKRRMTRAVTLCVLV